MVTRILLAAFLPVLLAVATLLVVGSGTADPEKAAAARTPATPPDSIAPRPLEGFGATTPGGRGGAAFTVTSLADAGPGSLREAVSGSHRSISFAVAGVIDLRSTLRVQGHHLTIDGGSAPPPGVTLTTTFPGFRGPLLELDGDDFEVHDVIVSHLRIQDNPDARRGDNVRLEDGVYNVVIDHCSLRRGGDGNFDLNDGVHDVTIQWSILAATRKNQLIRSGVCNVSLHHNLYAHGSERNPQLQESSLGIDMVNNVIFDWGGNYGTRVRDGSSANLVKNYYLPGPRSDVEDAVIIMETAGWVFSAGNVIPRHSDATGTTEKRLPAPAVTEMPAEEALMAVLDEAGALPRDAEDEAIIDEIRRILGRR